MNVHPLVLVVTSVVLSSFAQIAFKTGMASQSMQLAVNSQGILMPLLSLTGNAYVLAGGLLYGLSMLLWLFALVRLDVSVAYPFVALGVLLTIGLAALLLGEPLGVKKLAGAVLVVGGIVLVSAS